MAYRPATGVPFKVPALPVTARDRIRYHLRQRGLFITDLARVWDCHKHSAYRRMYCKKRHLSPPYIEAVVKLCELDELDATKLRLAAAREAGWDLDPKYVGLIK